MTDINIGKFRTDHTPNCEDPYKYEINFEGNIFGFVTCKEKNFLVILNKIIKPEEITNMSLDSNVKPGMLYPGVSNWWKIVRGRNSYLCISGPLSQAGKAAAYYQYYIIEEAFDLKSSPKVYYYFFGFNN